MFICKEEPPLHCCNVQSDLSLGIKKNKEMMEEQKDCSEQSEIWEIIVKRPVFFVPGKSNFLGFFNISVHFFCVLLVGISGGSRDTPLSCKFIRKI